MSLSTFSDLHLLGRGTYGCVYSGVRKADRVTYAIKVIEVTHLSASEKQDSLNEIRFMSSFPHPNIIRYFESFLEKETLCIVMEHAKHGDMYQFIQKALARGKLIDVNAIWLYFIQLLSALSVLHRHNVIHRDIKSKNIFLPSYNRAVLGDLGCSKHMKQALTRTQVGTPYYMSPELIQKQPYNGQSDMWALGVLVYEMITLHPPFLAEVGVSEAFARMQNIEDLSRRVCFTSAPPLPKASPAVLSSIVFQLLNKDPSQRPTADAILQSPEVQKRMAELMVAHHPQSSRSTLMSTLKIGSDAHSLALPASQYQENAPANFLPSRQDSLPSLPFSEVRATEKTSCPTPVCGFPSIPSSTSSSYSSRPSPFDPVLPAGERRGSVAPPGGPAPHRKRLMVSGAGR